MRLKLLLFLVCSLACGAHESKASTGCDQLLGESPSSPTLLSLGYDPLLLERLLQSDMAIRIVKENIHAERRYRGLFLLRSDLFDPLRLFDDSSTNLSTAALFSGHYSGAYGLLKEAQENKTTLGLIFEFQYPGHFISPRSPHFTDRFYFNTLPEVFDFRHFITRVGVVLGEQETGGTREDPEIETTVLWMPYDLAFSKDGELKEASLLTNLVNHPSAFIEKVVRSTYMGARPY